MVFFRRLFESVCAHSVSVKQQFQSRLCTNLSGHLMFFFSLSPSFSHLRGTVTNANALVAAAAAAACAHKPGPPLQQALNPALPVSVTWYTLSPAWLA